MAFDPRADGGTADLLAAPVDVEGLASQIHDDAHGAGRRSFRVPDVLVRFEVSGAGRLQSSFLDGRGRKVWAEERKENDGKTSGSKFVHEEQRHPSQSWKWANMQVAISGRVSMLLT